VSALVVAGCGDDGGDGGGGGFDIGSAVTVAWSHAEPVGDGRTLRVGYESDPCTRARRARVEQGEGEVTLTLLDPERDPEQACIQIVKPGCVLVELAEPLRGRRVVDGSPRPRGRLGPVSRKRFGRCRRIPTTS